MSSDLRLEGRIFVAGHAGLAGSAILRRLETDGYRQILTATHGELDLANSHEVEQFFAAHRPKYVFLAAARVGGILANQTYPADFIRENLAIQSNVIDAARRHAVRKLLFLGSSCIYPKNAPQPLQEDHLLTGPLEVTNEPYAIAKIAGIKMCAAYNRQYDTDFLCIMPTNLYGPGDNYDLQNSHVLPALIRKAHEAKLGHLDRMVLWGSGRPRREFMHADDLASASVFLMERYSAAQIGEFINVGVGTDLSILDLAKTVADVVGFRGAMAFDDSKPDGTPQKLLDISRLSELGWRAKIPLEIGVQNAYADFLARYSQISAEDDRAQQVVSIEVRP